MMGAVNNDNPMEQVGKEAQHAKEVEAEKQRLADEANGVTPSKNSDVGTTSESKGLSGSPTDQNGNSGKNGLEDMPQMSDAQLAEEDSEPKDDESGN